MVWGTVPLTFSSSLKIVNGFQVGVNLRIHNVTTIWAAKKRRRRAVRGGRRPWYDEPRRKISCQR